MGKKHIYFFIGTTAELIKLLSVIRECERRKVNFKIITSNQNAVNFNEFKSVLVTQKPYHEIKFKLPFKIPFVNTLLNFSIWSVISFFYSLSYFKKEFKGLDKKNAMLVVHGDTVSSLLGAACAKLLRVKLIHIESGLRSFNFFEPFPEEFCRFVVSNLADVHFCPNSWSINNLKRYKGVKINTQNNTLIESLSAILKVRRKSNYVKLLSDKKFFLLVLHRQEHIFFKKSLTKQIIKIFNGYANKDLRCVLVLHKLTGDFMKKENLFTTVKRNKNFIFIPRLPYGEFMQIMEKAEFVATDGGSNQEEAYYMGKPCLILRNVTERIEGLGTNAVLSKGNDKIIRNFLRNYKRYRKSQIQYAVSPSKIVVDYLTK